MSDIFFNDDEEEKKRAINVNPVHESVLNKRDEYIQQVNQQVENHNKYGIDAPDETYLFLDDFAKTHEYEDFGRLGAAYALSAELPDIPLEDAYANLEAYNAQIFGEDKFAGDRRTNGKAITDQFTLGRNNLKKSRLYNELMAAELDGDTELADKINAQIEAVKSENETLEDHSNRNKLTEGLEIVFNSAPYTFDVMAAGAIGRLSMLIPGMQYVGAALAFGESSSLMIGDLYGTLREQGNSPEVASRLAKLFGSLQGLAETAIGEASNYILPSGPLEVGNKYVQKYSGMLANSIANKLQLNNVTRKLLHVFFNYGAEVLGEGVEELIQEIESVAAEHTGQVLEQLDVPTENAAEIAKRLGENFAGGVIGALGLGVLGLGINTATGLASVRQIEKDAIDIPSEEMFVAKEMMKRKDADGNEYTNADVFETESDEEKKQILRETWRRANSAREEAERLRAQSRAEINSAAEGFEEGTVDEETGETKYRDVYREYGRLSAQEDITSNEDGTVNVSYRVGDREVADKNLYGNIDATVDEVNKKVTINSFTMSKAREGLRQEMYEGFADKYAGYDIQWNTLGSDAAAVKESLISKNPSGKANGLNYYDTLIGTKADADARRKAYTQIKEAYSKAGIELSNAQVEADTALLESLYKRIGRDLKGVNSFSDYINYTFGENIFGNKEEAFAAAKRQNEKGRVAGTSVTRTIKEFEQGMKAVVYVTENGDFSTFSHEIAHIARKQLQGDLLQEAEKAFGVENGQWTTAQEEAFAYGFEKFLHTGQAKNSALKELFTKMAQFLSDVYNFFTKADVKISPEIAKVYNELLSEGDDSVLRNAERISAAEDRAAAIEARKAEEAAARKEEETQKAQKEEDQTEADRNSEVNFQEESSIAETTQETTEDPITKDEIDALLDGLPISEETKSNLKDLTENNGTIAEKDAAVIDAANEASENVLKGNEEENEEHNFQATPKEIAEAMDYLNTFTDPIEKKRIEDNLIRCYIGKDGKVTPWYHATITALRCRRDINALLDGLDIAKDSPLLDKQNKSYYEALTNGNTREERIQSLIEHFSSETSMLGEPSKSIWAVAGSFINCEPSLDCATYCYAAGHRLANYFTTNRELINLIIETNPKKAAKMVSKEYASTAEFYKGVALRLLDTGDLSPQWIEFVNYLNEYKEETEDGRTLYISCQIFSKRPELLEKIDRNKNVVILSLDESNEEIGERYPDLPKGYVFSGSEHAKKYIIDHKDSFINNKGVILPVVLKKKDFTSQDAIRDLPHWTLNYLCPIDAKFKEIGSPKERKTNKDVWNCSVCDTNGQGCFFARAIKDRKKFYATLESMPNDILKEHYDAIRAVTERKLRAAGYSEETIRSFLETLDGSNAESLGRLNTGRTGQVSGSNDQSGNGENGTETKETTKEKHLMQIIGEKGASNMDKIRNTEKLIQSKNYAKWMESAGRSAKDIRLATGWEKGVDDKWRYEIPDLKLKNNPKWQQYTMEDGTIFHNGFLPDIIDAPELFEAYPELKYYNVLTNLKSLFTKGSFDDEGKLIQLNNDWDKKSSKAAWDEVLELEQTPESQEWDAKFEELDKKYGYNDKLSRDEWLNAIIGTDYSEQYDNLWKEYEKSDIYKKIKTASSKEVSYLDPSARSTLIHEVQHAIQQIEGFAQGGNPEQFENYVIDSEELQNQLDQENRRLKSFELSQKAAQLAGENEVAESYVDAIEEVKNNISALESRLSEIEENALDGSVEVDGQVYESTHDAYRSLAGEVESRNTQARKDMSIQERLTTLLAETEDIDRDQQLVLFQIVKDAMAAEESLQPAETEDQLEAVRQKYINTDKWMKAPNGKDTNLTEKQWLQVRTDNFKKWFGDWENDTQNASKVLDENGEPLVVYHGTRAKNDFDVFNTTEEKYKDNIGSHFGPKSTAEEFSENRIYEVYLNIRKPFKPDFDFFADIYDNAYLEILIQMYKEMKSNKAQEIFNKIYDIFPNLKDYDFKELDVLEEFYEDEGLESPTVGKDQQRYAMVDIMLEMMAAEGYDGMQYENWYEGDENNECYVILKPNQVKSAVNNNGNFDENNPSMLFQKILDPKEIERLNSEKTVKAYAAMQLSDVKDQNKKGLFPPMAKKVKGKTVEAAYEGDWFKSDEHPEIAFFHTEEHPSRKYYSLEEAGDEHPKMDVHNPTEIAWYFDLKKDGKDPSGKDLGTVEARFNPYWHSTLAYTPLAVLNDQFSSAYKRPNIVIVEVEIPVSDLESGYKAYKAKDPVGQITWHEGPVSRMLDGTPDQRIVLLSQYKKIGRVLSNEEVAELAAPGLIKYGIPVPDNTMTPGLVAELKKRGVTIEETQLVKDWNEKLDAMGKDPMLFQTVYHGSAANFDNFDTENYGLSGEGSMSFGYGTYVTASEDVAKDYAQRQFAKKRAEALGNKDGGYESDIESLFGDLKNGFNFEDAKNRRIDYLKSIFDEFDNASWKGKVQDRLDYINSLNENDIKNRHLYTVEIPNDGYLKWDEEVPSSQRKYIADKLYEKLIQEDYKGAEKELKYELKPIIDTDLNGKEIYDNIWTYLGGNKEASEFLSSIGYSGIDYPAGTNFGRVNDGVRNYVIFNDEDAKIIEHMQFQTESEMMDEARSFETWQEWMEFIEVMGKPEVSPIPFDADAQWYQTAWELANGIQTEESINKETVENNNKQEGMLPNAQDALFTAELRSNPELLDDFMRRVAYYKYVNIDDLYANVANEEEDAERTKLEELQDYIDVTLADRNFGAAINSVRGGKEIPESTRKKILTEITDPFKSRQFRALFAEVMEMPEYAVDEKDSISKQLRDKFYKYEKRYYDLVKPSEDFERMSPQRLKTLAAEMSNRDIAAKVRNGTLHMDDEIQNYIKSLNDEIKNLTNKYNDLQKETQEDYQRLADTERKALLRLHEQLLIARSKLKKADGDISRKLRKGIKITSKYQERSQNLRADYNELYRKFSDLKATIEISKEVEDALARQEERVVVKDQLDEKQHEKNLAEEVKKMRIQLVKRTMRRVPFDKIDYTNAKTIIAIQRMLEPNLIGGVNRWIGVKTPYVRGVLSSIITDADYKDKLIKYFKSKRISSNQYKDFVEKLENTKSVKDLANWSDKDLQYAAGKLPKEDWIKDLNLQELAKERKESIDLDLYVQERNRTVTDPKTGKDVVQTSYELKVGKDIEQMVKDAIGTDMYYDLTGLPFNEWTTEKLEQLATIINNLYKEGRDILEAKKQLKIEEAAKIRKQIEDVVNNTGIVINDDDTPEEKERKQKKINTILGIDSNVKGTNAARDYGFKAKINRLLHSYNDATVLRVARILDGYKEGTNVKELYKKENDCYNNKTRSINNRAKTIEQVMKENHITTTDLAKEIEVGGRKFTIDELLFFAAANEDYEEDQTKLDKGLNGLAANDDYAPTSRNAVMFGNMLSDSESLKYKQMLTEEDKEMQRKIESGELTVDEQVALIEHNLIKNPGTLAYIEACKTRYADVIAAANNLDPKFKNLMAAIANDYAEQYERMNEVSVREFNTPVHRVRCYVPLVRLESNGDTNINQVKEDLLANAGAAGKQWVNKGMTKHRVNISPLNQKPVQSGLYKTWADSVERTEHFISYSPYVTELNRIYKSRDAQFTRAYIENRYGKGMLKYLDDYINEVANPSANKVREAGSELMHTLRGKTAPAYLAWKASAIVKQGLTSPWPYMQFIDPAHYLAASFKCITSGGKMYDVIREKSVFMNNRVMDPMNDLIDEMAEKTNQNKVSRGVNKFSKVGMAGLEWIDWVSVAPGWLACYQKEYARLNGKNTDVYEATKTRLQEENMYADIGTSAFKTAEQIEAIAQKAMADDLELRAVEYADNCTRQCQPSNRSVDISPLFKNTGEFAKAYLQFQTSLNVIWQNIRYDIPYALRQKEFARITGIIIGYVLAGVFMNSVMEGYSDDDDDDKKKLKELVYYATTQFTDAVPMIGSELTNTVDKLITGKASYQSSGTDMTPTASKFFAILTNAKKGKWEKAAEMTAEGIGMYMGLPVSGAKEIKKIVGVGDGDGAIGIDLGKVYGILDNEQ